MEGVPVHLGRNKLSRGISGKHMKAHRVLLFMAYLYMHEGMRDEQIRRAVSSVAFMFESAGTESELFKLSILSRGRKASTRSNEECVEKENMRADIDCPTKRAFLLSITSISDPGRLRRIRRLRSGSSFLRWTITLAAGL